MNRCRVAVGLAALTAAMAPAQADADRKPRPPRLTRSACVEALYPGGSWARRVTGTVDGDRPVRAVEVLTAGSMALCRVDVQAFGSVDVRIAPVVYEHGWRARGWIRSEYSVTSADEIAATGHALSGHVAVAPIALAAGVTTIDVVVTTDESGPMMSDHREAHALWRVSPAMLSTVFTYESHTSGGESSDADDCTLAIEDTAHHGWRDLSLTCVHRHGRYPGNPDDQDRESTTTDRATWAGRAYATP